MTNRYRKYSLGQKAQVVYDFIESMASKDILRQNSSIRRGAELAAEIDYERQLSHPEEYCNEPRRLNQQTICEWYAEAKLNKFGGLSYAYKKLRKLKRDEAKKKDDEKTADVERSSHQLQHEGTTD